VLTSTAVKSVEAVGKGLKLDIGANSLEADLVVCATGVRPNIEFLADSGIQTDQGILVDDRLQTNIPGIYAAGDVAQGPDFSTGERMVHAIQPTASEHGQIAAANMAGIDTTYRGSLIMNVLNTLGLITASYGLWQGVKGGDRAVTQDKSAFKYLRLEFDGDLLVGSLSLGLTQHVGVLRGLIQTKAPLGPWKARLMQNPHLIMEAYLECAQGQNVRAHPGMPR
jgi:NAD(P)H-nitrite reductase large subunit